MVWTFAAQERSARRDLDRPSNPRRPAGAYAAYVADQQGFVYALDAATGRMLWKQKVDDHPLVRLTGSPTLHAGRLYVPTSSYEEGGRPPGYACCTFRGSVVGARRADGRRGVEDLYHSRGSRGCCECMPTAPSCAAGGRRHLVGADHRRQARALYVGVGNTYSGAAQATTDAILAFDLKSGKMRWARQMAPATPDVFGCVPGDITAASVPGPTSTSARRRCWRRWPAAGS